MSGFPNLFMLYGPNTNLGHNSIIFMLERQIGYVLPVRRTAGRSTAGRRSTSDPSGHGGLRTRPSRRGLAQTVWAGDCHSWYKNDAGRITNNWPDYSIDYARRMRRPDPAEWTTEPSSANDSMKRSTKARLRTRRIGGSSCSICSR